MKTKEFKSTSNILNKLFAFNRYFESTFLKIEFYKSLHSCYRILIIFTEHVIFHKWFHTIKDLIAVPNVTQRAHRFGCVKTGFKRWLFSRRIIMRLI